MNNGKGVGRRVLRRFYVVVLLAGASGAVWGRGRDQALQQSQNLAGEAPAATRTQAGPGKQDQAQDQEQTQDQTNQSQKQAGKSARPTQANPTQANPAQASPAQASPAQEETKITPRQAAELFHSVDEILAFDSKQTGLAVKREVKRTLTSREEVVSYLNKNKDDKDTQRLRRSELVLKKFGLLPRDFDLEKLLVDLLREQVAGYYDPKTKTVHLLDWVPIEEQEPVMAHELTHALQDQAVNLDKWMGKGEKDLAETRKNPTPLDIENDETDNARQAVVEGQAEAVMLQYALAPVGRTIVDSPDLVEDMESSMTNGTPDSTVFKDAPIFLKESLTFPYRYGLEFEVKLLQKGGREKAFAGVLANPPHTTRQIMEPETYLSGEKIAPMAVPNFKRDFKNYQKFDIGAMGEFDVAVLIEQYANQELAKWLYPEWRGGYYYAARVKGDAAAPLGLLYVSRWSSAEKAADFAGIYAHSLAKRYKKVEEVGNANVASGKSGGEGARDVPAKDAPAKETSSKETSSKHKGFKVIPLQGRHAWSTEEGTVVIDEQGDTVLVSESLDAATTETLEREVFATAAAK
ncbi:MAG TPA: hypothetical protein VKR60_16495 [Candidatus Sulfotelmatobacter sp.]|nr:hypothetical protein [Candidatus Sulfotelmatobacter sp.]